MGEFVFSVMGLKITDGIGRSYIDVDRYAECLNSLFRLESTSNLPHVPNDLLLVNSFTRCPFVPSKNPNICTTLPLQLEETSLLISIQFTLSYKE